MSSREVEPRRGSGSGSRSGLAHRAEYRQRLVELEDERHLVRTRRFQDWQAGYLGVINLEVH
jgi:hypothetical protein